MQRRRWQRYPEDPAIISQLIESWRRLKCWEVLRTSAQPVSPVRSEHGCELPVHPFFEGDHGTRGEEAVMAYACRRDHVAERGRGRGNHIHLLNTHSTALTWTSRLVDLRVRHRLPLCTHDWHASSADESHRLPERLILCEARNLCGGKRPCRPETWNEAAVSCACAARRVASTSLLAFPPRERMINEQFVGLSSRPFRPPATSATRSVCANFHPKRSLPSEAFAGRVELPHLLFASPALFSPPCKIYTR